MSPIALRLPQGARCAIALTYDTDMAGGYAPDGICHGRTMPALQQYMLRLCDTADAFGVKLQFFQIGNGLEEPDLEYLREILRRGHMVDSHTYSHMPLTGDPETLRDELERTNRLFEERLGWRTTVLRGPGGYQDGLRGLPANQQVILDCGSRWVSCQYDGTLQRHELRYAIEAPGRDLPYAYETGLREFPIQGYTDRVWFDTLHCVDQAAYDAWRKARGHQPVAPGWRAPWTAPDALDRWIEYNLAVADLVYEQRLVWVACWHPYSHYLHDPENRMLPAMLKHCAAKPERVWVGTFRDAVGMAVA
jgi:peptidoglycan/xylan/chitin deacetylase (PgdA/CDA1 family)